MRNNQMRNARTAFTIIELLVVISIIGILLGITVPAVNSVRESARITQCRNNLRNQALAMLQYESAHRLFPPGQVAPEPTGQWWEPVNWDGYSGLGHLWFALPFLEEQTIYDRFQSSHANDEFWGTLPGLPQAANLHVETLRCPSDVSGTIRLLNYSVLNFLPGETLSMVATPVSSDHVGWTNYLGSRGAPSLSNKQQAGPTGIFFEGRAVRVRDVRDGLSNTILMGETVGGTTGPASARDVDTRHSIFQNGIGHYKFFFDDSDDQTDDLSFMYSSWHRGGRLVNFAFSDGHVESKHSDADRRLLRELTTRAGD